MLKQAQYLKFIFMILLTCGSLALYFDWYYFGYAQNTGIWARLDQEIFYFFNQHLVPINSFTYFVAWINIRIFDIVPLICMALIYGYYFLKADYQQRLKLISVLLFMMLYAFVVKQIISYILPYERMSPTYVYEDSNLISKLVDLPISPKDRARSCFPGDHGIMLLIFSFIILKYINVRAFLLGLATFLIFSWPRVMGGAHWFSDIAVGAVAFSVLFSSWALLTPFSDLMVAIIQKQIVERVEAKRLKKS